MLCRGSGMHALKPASFCYCVDAIKVTVSLLDSLVRSRVPQLFVSPSCMCSVVAAADGGVLWPHYHCCDCRVEGCKRHRPLGCREYYESQGYNNPRYWLLLLSYLLLDVNPMCLCPPTLPPSITKCWALPAVGTPPTAFAPSAQ
jgi:hypothetical protein